MTSVEFHKLFAAALAPHGGDEQSGSDELDRLTAINNMISFSGVAPELQQGRINRLTPLGGLDLQEHHRWQLEGEIANCRDILYPNASGRGA